MFYLKLCHTRTEYWFCWASRKKMKWTEKKCCFEIGIIWKKSVFHLMRKIVYRFMSRCACFKTNLTFRYFRMSGIYYFKSKYKNFYEFGRTTWGRFVDQLNQRFDNLNVLLLFLLLPNKTAIKKFIILLTILFGHRYTEAIYSKIYICLCALQSHIHA